MSPLEVFWSQLKVFWRRVEVFWSRVGGLLGRLRLFLLDGPRLEAGGLVRRRAASTGRAAGAALVGRESLGGGGGARHVEGSGGFSVELILGDFVGHNLRFGGLTS